MLFSFDLVQSRKMNNSFIYLFIYKNVSREKFCVIIDIDEVIVYWRVC